MPQYLTLSVGAKVDKGPEIKSEAKFESGPYGAVIEEQVCKCNESGEIELIIEDLSKIDMLVIAADKYSVDKESCMTLNGVKNECKRIKYWFIPKVPVLASDADEKMKQLHATEMESHKAALKKNKEDPFYLTRPHILLDPFLKQVLKNPIGGIVVSNELTSDIKISALVVRKTKTECDLNREAAKPAH
jgi:hypothetical protein